MYAEASLPHIPYRKRARAWFRWAGDDVKTDALAVHAKWLTKIRTFPTGKLLGENAQADFLVLFSRAEES